MTAARSSLFFSLPPAARVELKGRGSGSIVRSAAMFPIRVAALATFAANGEGEGL
jgi:hypothetical protein